jgi:hypothetical protein
LRPRHGIGPRHSNDAPFSGPGAVLVRPLSRMQACAAGQRDHSAVDHLDRPIPGAACSNRRHDFLIEPGARSSCKPAPHSVPFAEAFRQVAPGRAGPGDPEDPEDAFQDLPVVDRRAASAPTDRRQKRREQRPRRVVDDVSVQGWLPFSSLESCRWGYGNPLCPHGLNASALSPSFRSRLPLPTIKVPRGSPSGPQI